MTEKRKIMIYDSEDIIISCQYIMLKNFFDWATIDEEFYENSVYLRNVIAETGLSLIKAIMSRSEEFAITHEEFEQLVSIAATKGLLKDGDMVKLDTPYSIIVKTLAIATKETDVWLLYDNDMEKTLLENRFSILENVRILSVNEFILETPNLNIENISAVYTARTRLIDYLIKETEIPVVYPNTLKYIENKYKNESNVIPIHNVWSSVE